MYGSSRKLAQKDWEMCSLMLKAWMSLVPALARELEPVRERVAAQYAFAEVYSERKLGPCSERLKK